METVLNNLPQRVPSTFVAVKVLHPNVERTVRRDLKIMGFFAAVLNAIPTIEWLSLPGEVAQFGEMMKLQLDLRIEAANLETFRQNFKDRSTAWFPYPYTEFTTRNVLVEEFAQGIPLADFMENGGGVFQHDIADEGLDAFLRMLLLDNFVHADLHPGNIMVRFYQAAQPELRLRRSHDKHPRDEKPDVTEQVLERLRPFRHRKNKAAWEAELPRSTPRATARSSSSSTRASSRSSTPPTARTSWRCSAPWPSSTATRPATSCASAAASPTRCWTRRSSRSRCSTSC